MKIKQMPGTKLSAETLLHQAIEDIGDIESIAMIIQYKDKTLRTEWSNQCITELSFKAMTFQKDVLHELNREF